MKNATAEVYSDSCVTLADTEQKKFRLNLLKQAAAANAKNSKHLTTEERKGTILKMLAFGEPVGSVIDWALRTRFCSRWAIYDWTHEEVQEKKLTESELKENCFQLYKAGNTSASWLSRETGVARTTIIRWLNEFKTAGKGGVQLFPGYNWTPPSEKADHSGQHQITSSDQFPLIPQPQPTSDAEARVIINQMYDLLSNLTNTSKATETELRISFFPHLVEKFPSISKTIAEGGFMPELDRLHLEKSSLEREYYNLSAAKANLEEEVKTLKENLKKRNNDCKYTCEFSTVRVQEENDKAIGYLIDQLRHHIEVLPLVDPVSLPFVLQLTLRGILPIVTTLEWSSDNGLSTDTIRKAMQDLSALLTPELLSQLNAVKLPGENIKCKGAC